MVVAVTGTRRGMSQAQVGVVPLLYRRFDLTEMHNGACEGSDRQFFTLLDCFPRIHFWPSNEEQQRWALQKVKEFPRMDIEVHGLHRPLVRDRIMVARAKQGGGALIATPHSFGEELRSGTWATVRYAREVKLTRYIVTPAGAVEIQE